VLRAFLELTPGRGVLFTARGFGQRLLLGLFLCETRGRRQLATGDGCIRFCLRGALFELTASRCGFLLEAPRAFLQFTASRLGFLLSALRARLELTASRFDFLLPAADLLLELTSSRCDFLLSALRALLEVVPSSRGLLAFRGRRRGALLCVFLRATNVLLELTANRFELLLGALPALLELTADGRLLFSLCSVCGGALLCVFLRPAGRVLELTAGPIDLFLQPSNALFRVAASRLRLLLSTPDLLFEFAACGFDFLSGPRPFLELAVGCFGLLLRALGALLELTASDHLLFTLCSVGGSALLCLFLPAAGCVLELTPGRIDLFLQPSNALFQVAARRLRLLLRALNPFFEFAAGGFDVLSASRALLELTPGCFGVLPSALGAVLELTASGCLPIALLSLGDRALLCLLLRPACRLRQLQPRGFGLLLRALHAVDQLAPHRLPFFLRAARGFFQLEANACSLLLRVLRDLFELAPGRVVDLLLTGRGFGAAIDLGELPPHRLEFGLGSLE
jgi:hypothetical protein